MRVMHPRCGVDWVAHLYASSCATSGFESRAVTGGGAQRQWFFSKGRQVMSKKVIRGSIKISSKTRG